MKLAEQKLKELQKIEAKTSEAKENLAQIQKHCKDTQDRLESAKKKTLEGRRRSRIPKPSHARCTK